jgi:hypothetical protein
VTSTPAWQSVVESFTFSLRPLTNTDRPGLPTDLFVFDIVPPLAMTNGENDLVPWAVSFLVEHPEMLC